MKIFLMIALLFPALIFAEQPHIKLSHKISNQFVKDYSYQTGSSLVGFGGGLMGDVDLIILAFSSKEKNDISAARRLFVNGVEELLKRYNSELAIRPYLHNYPFNLTNLNFSILFQEPSGRFVSSEFVAHVCSNLTTVFYGQNENGKLKDLYEEPYERAVQIVRDENEKAAGSGIKMKSQNEREPKVPAIPKCFLGQGILSSDYS